MLKEKRCPQCSYQVSDPGAVRCPRCHKSFLTPGCCSGNCSKCGEQREGREKCPEARTVN